MVRDYYFHQVCQPSAMSQLAKRRRLASVEFRTSRRFQRRNSTWWLMGMCRNSLEIHEVSLVSRSGVVNGVPQGGGISCRAAALFAAFTTLKKIYENISNRMRNVCSSFNLRSGYVLWSCILNL